MAACSCEARILDESTPESFIGGWWEQDPSTPTGTDDLDTIIQEQAFKILKQKRMIESFQSFIEDLSDGLAHWKDSKIDFGDWSIRDEMLERWWIFSLENTTAVLTTE